MIRAGLILASTILLLATGTLGCKKNTPLRDTVPGKPVLRIQQKDFLTGELKFLESHLRLRSAARLKIQPIGFSQYYFHEMTERWAIGKKLSGLGESDWGGGSCTGAGDFSISLQSKEETKSKIAFNTVRAIVCDSGTLSLTSPLEIEWTKPATGYYQSFEKRLDASIDLSADEEASVWGYYYYGNQKSVQMDKSFEELAQGAEWAIILKVKWKEWKPAK